MMSSNCWCVRRRPPCRRRAWSIRRRKPTRIDKDIAKANADIKRVDAKLGSEKFVANAPEEFVEEEMEEARRRRVSRARRGNLAALDQLQNVGRVSGFGALRACLVLRDAGSSISWSDKSMQTRFTAFWPARLGEEWIRKNSAIRSQNSSMRQLILYTGRCFWRSSFYGPA